MSYIYTLVVESQNPSSIPASFLIRNAKKVVLWLICGLFVAYLWPKGGGWELLTHVFVAKVEDVEVYQKLTKCRSFENDGSGTDLAAGSEYVSGIAAWTIRLY